MTIQPQNGKLAFGYAEQRIKDAFGPTVQLEEQEASA